MKELLSGALQHMNIGLQHVNCAGSWNVLMFTLYQHEVIIKTKRPNIKYFKITLDKVLVFKLVS